MSEDFVTVASFASEMEADFVRSQLEEAGVRAFVAVGGLLGLSGVQSESKVLVASSDVRLALAVLSDATAEEEKERPSSPREAITDRPPTSTAITDEAPDDDEPEGTPLTQREEMAVNALTGALLGVLVLPLQLYVSWLLWKVYLSDEPLGDGPRGRAWVALLLNVPLLLALALFTFSIL